ncbi:MAG: pentapeptide repeat-containing protein [Planctomycetes bacterium]|nr:pentapeptide repeat-containing protein [Planctomycetota bacterium]
MSDRSEARRAAVRPRVRKHGSALALLLEEEIAELLRSGARHEVRLCGPRGSGKSTALRHLAALFPDEPRLVLIDDGEPWMTPPASEPLVVVRTTRDRHEEALRPDFLWFYLASWSDDELLEYALARHREQVSALMAKLQSSPWPRALRAEPASACLVLDRLATDPMAVDLATALQRVIAEDLPAEPKRLLERAAYLDLACEARPPQVERLLSHHALLDLDETRALLGALGILRALESDPSERIFPIREWSPELVAALRTQLVGDQQIAAAAWSAMHRPADRRALLLSLLCIARPELRIEGLRDVVLERAYLPEAQLGDLGPNLMLAACVLRGASLVGRSIKSTRFERCDLRETSWNGAEVELVRFEGGAFEGACFARATLRGVTWQGLKLEGKVFDGSRLIAGMFTEVNLAGTAILGWSASMTHFTRCDLTRARFPRADLSHTRFTACRMHGIELCGSDLSCADLRGAQFHFGNSRSGLVGSPLASEGTRTGFYADEHRERTFLSPEAVRVADFTHCKLRGAQLEGADFYLVDFRGADLDPEQRAYLQRCRAILD